MTEFIWDGSSFDGHISVAQFRQAMTEGVVAFTHRLLRQTGDVDPYAAGNLSNARAAGFGLLGAYGVTYTRGGDAQDDLLVRLADQQIPWWRSFAGWFWQEDLEKWPTDPVAASLGISSAQQLRAGTGRRVVLYASHSQYGDQLRGWDGPLWNADYTSRPAGTVRAMYPGDDWRPLHGSGTSAWRGGWAPYSGREPDLLQFTSSATIGGLITCDASAYRGTYDQLRALLAPAAVPQIDVTPSLQGGPMYLAQDTTDGSLTKGAVFLVVDRRSYHITDPKIVSEIINKHECGAITLGTDNGKRPGWWLPWKDTAGQDVPGIVLTGWRAETDGPIDTGPVSVDVQALAAALTAGLVAQGVALTQDQVSTAVGVALRDPSVVGALGAELVDAALKSLGLARAGQ